MTLTKSRRNLLLIAALLLTFMPEWSTPPDAAAYKTARYWNTSAIYYRLHVNLGSSLGLSQAAVQTQIDLAATTWNVASRLDLYRTTLSTAPLITTEVMQEEGRYGVTLLWAAPSGFPLTGTYEMRLNNRYNFHWNTSGVQGRRPGGPPFEYDADVRSIVSHEFGHVLGLTHPDDSDGLQVRVFPTNPSTNTQDATQSIMGRGFDTSSIPRIDDKLAIAMTYGIDTGFEQSQYLGLDYNPDDPALPPGYLRVSTWGSPSCSGADRPWYWTYNYANEPIGNNKPPLGSGNNRVMRFDGCSKTTGSPNYAYATFTTAFFDKANGCGSPCYFEIKSNTNVRWYQYNYSQCTISIDIEFAEPLQNYNGTTTYYLRDYRPAASQRYKDTAGVSVHPADRDCSKYSQGSWFYNQINLGTFAGKHIKRFIIAYDNSNTNIKGDWRAYFDPIILGS